MVSDQDKSSKFASDLTNIAASAIVDILEDMADVYEANHDDPGTSLQQIIKVLSQILGKYLSGFPEDVREEMIRFAREQAYLLIKDADNEKESSQPKELKDMTPKGQA